MAIAGCDSESAAQNIEQSGSNKKQTASTSNKETSGKRMLVVSGGDGYIDFRVGKQLHKIVLSMSILK